MRLAHANVRNGVLCLGDPAGRHVRLLPDGVHTSPGPARGDGAPGDSPGDRDDDYDEAGGYDEPGDYDEAGGPDELGGYDEVDDYDVYDAGPDGSRYDEDDDEPDDGGAAGTGGPQGSWTVTAWGDLAALEVDAPVTRWRYPGVLSTVVAAVLGNLGVDTYAEAPTFDVEVTTAGGVEIVRCDGFAGRGYWEPHARAVEALLRVLVSEPAARAWLSTPGDLLAVVSTLARRGPTDDALADEVRSALLLSGPAV